MKPTTPPLDVARLAILNPMLEARSSGPQFTQLPLDYNKSYPAEEMNVYHPNGLNRGYCVDQYILGRCDCDAHPTLAEAMPLTGGPTFAGSAGAKDAQERVSCAVQPPSGEARPGGRVFPEGCEGVGERVRCR